MRRGNQVLSKIRPQVVQVCRVWCLVDMKSFCNPCMGNVKMSSSVLVSPYMFANISCIYCILNWPYYVEYIQLGEFVLY